MQCKKKGVLADKCMHERKATLFALLIKNEGWRKTK